MKTIETKMTKSGNITVKVNGERTNLKIAAAILDRAMFASNNETAEIVNEAGEKFTYGGREWKQGYMRYYFNNDNGKSFEIYNVNGYNAVAESAIREIANMPAIEKMNAEHQASQIRLEEIFAINDYVVSPEAQEIAINAEETAATVKTETDAEVTTEVNDDIRKLVEAIAESGREYLETHLPCGVRRDKLAETLTAIHNDIMDAHDKLDVKIIEGAPKAEIEALAEHIAELNRRYSELYKVTYPDGFCETSTPDEVIAAAIELLTIVDSDGNEIKPAAAAMFTDTAEVDEPEVTETERKIAEQVCDSMTAAAPDDWSVAFTENGKFAVYSGDSVNVVDTITAGDFLNPKEFFEQFRRKPTQAELDDPNVAALAELNHEREQLLTVRDELAREYPDEVERLKLLDEMIAETDADITALKTFKKPRDAVEFDDKGNVKAVWF